MYKVMLVALIVAAGTGQSMHAAGGWADVSDDRMAAVLAARTIRFADGETWGFGADGSALSGKVEGRWSQGDETVCLIWSGLDAACYRLEEKGIDLRFTPVSGGEARIARYIDL